MKRRQTPWRRRKVQVTSGVEHEKWHGGNKTGTGLGPIVVCAALIQRIQVLEDHHVLSQNHGEFLDMAKCFKIFVQEQCHSFLKWFS